MTEETPFLSVGECVAPTVGTRSLNSDPMIVTEKTSSEYLFDVFTSDGVISKSINSDNIIIDTDEKIEGEPVIHITSGDIAGTYISKRERPNVSDINTVRDYSTGNKRTYILPHTTSETTIPMVSLSGSVTVKMPIHTLQRRILLDEADVMTPKEVVSDEHTLHYQDGKYKTNNGVTFDDPLQCLIFQAGVSVGNKMPTIERNHD